MGPHPAAPCKGELPSLPTPLPLRRTPSTDESHPLTLTRRGNGSHPPLQTRAASIGAQSRGRPLEQPPRSIATVAEIGPPLEEGDDSPVQPLTVGIPDDASNREFALCGL